MTPIAFQGQKLDIVVKPHKDDTDWTISATTVKTWYTYLWQEDDTYWFSRSGVKGQGHILNVKVCKQDKPYLIANYNVISLLH